MAQNALKKLVIFGDPKKGKISGAVDEFVQFVKGKAEITANCLINQCSVDMLEESDFAVVFGGDGSIISAARSLCESNVPVIGVNLGKLGFLAEFSLDELKEHLDDILSGKAKIEKRMILKCSVTGNDGCQFHSKAINDVFIAAGPPFSMIELKILVDGQPLAGCVSDGLIISTPTGSTAYNLSAGGPILSARMEAMVIAPICPHSLNFRPIVINADSKIEVIGVNVNESTTVLVDGQVSTPLAKNDVLTIEKDTCEFLIVDNPLRTKWDTLATKLSWAEKPRYKNS